MKPRQGLLALLFALGCGPASPETSSTDSLIDADARRWPEPRSLPICFINRHAIDEGVYADLLRHTVTQYQRAGIVFQKWRDCTSDDYDRPMIRVAFKDVYDWHQDGHYWFGGGKSRVGMSRTGLSGERGATLFIKLDRSYPGREGRKRETIVKATRSAFLHEIGHALGLLHEHTRTDYKPEGGECKSASAHDNVQEQAGRVDYIGRPDYDSVMSYCNLTVDVLSRGDIAGIHALYPELK